MNSTFSPKSPRFAKVLNYFIKRSQNRPWFCTRVTTTENKQYKLYTHTYNDAQFITHLMSVMFSDIKNVILFNKKGKLAYYKMSEGKLVYTKFKQA